MLITQLINLFFVDWNITLTNKALINTSIEINSIRILTNKLYFKGNVLDKSQFVYSSQLDIKEPEIYD